VVDGATYPIHGVEWIVRREDLGDEPRFVCTNVVDPSES
jgi:hypothetical protein